MIHYPDDARVHVRLDQRSLAALGAIQSELREQGSRGSASDAIRHAILKVARKRRPAVPQPA